MWLIVEGKIDVKDHIDGEHYLNIHLYRQLCGNEFDERNILSVHNNIIHRKNVRLREGDFSDANGCVQCDSTTKMQTIKDNHMHRKHVGLWPQRL